MEAVVVRAFGGPDELALADLPELSPAAQEVIVSVEAAGVGYVDVMVRSGRYPGVTAPGMVPGIEVAGRILAVGSAVAKTCIGQRVFAMITGGGYAKEVKVDASRVLALPVGITSDMAVSLGVNALVAWFVCQRAQVAKESNVLVRGASGGIGALAVQIASRKGARVTAVTSSAERGHRLQALGASTIIDRKAGPTATGASLDVVIDPVGGTAVSTFLEMLNTNGRYVLCGRMAGPVPADFGQHLLKTFQKSLSFSTLSLDSIDPLERLSILSQLFMDSAAGNLVPLLGSTYPLSKAADAHKAMEAGAIFGKLVINP